MSNRPNPVALTAAMLMDKALSKALAQHSTIYNSQGVGPLPYACANLASAIHRLAPACKRLAVSEANGTPSNLTERLPRRIAALSAQLAPFGYSLERDDANLYLVSDTNRHFIA